MSNWFARFVANWNQRHETRSILGTIGIKAVQYTRAFDVGPAECRFCGRGLRMLLGQESVQTPRGEWVQRERRFGYACLSCGIAANSDLDPEEKWVRVEDFRP